MTIESWRTGLLNNGDSIAKQALQRQKHGVLDFVQPNFHSAFALHVRSEWHNFTLGCKTKKKKSNN
jgi:hypothetical protein